MRPPLTDEAPWRATSVPMKMCCELRGSTEIAPIERLLETAGLPGTSDQWLPPSVDL